jgi:metallophosphoesterase (TIGR00282 family)
MIGDIVGRPGRMAVQKILPGLREQLGLDIVVANGENAAGGLGLTPDTALEILSYGVDVITSGNHIWDKKEIIPFLNDNTSVLRPLNYPDSTPGSGYVTIDGALIVNLIGRVFIGNFDDPFRAMDSLLPLQQDVLIKIVDIHAEATSEKAALGWYLDGKVSVVAGTHTHVATADCRILPKGTGFVSDLGMCGAVNSIIGAKPEDVLNRFLDQIPHRISFVKTGPVRFNSVMFDVDDLSGTVLSTERVDREFEV